MAWTPGQNKQQRALEVPYDDVPAHLMPHLTTWVEGNAFKNRDVSVEDLAILLRLEFDPLAGPSSEIKRRCQDPHFLLDVVEILLERGYPSRLDVDELDDLLALANSIYKINSSGDGLEVRVGSGVKELVTEVVASASNSAGEHLTNAWNEAYGRTVDPGKSYSESIKAVEAALAPIISPKNTRATLGTIRRDLKLAPTKWKFTANSTADSMNTVTGMVCMLWEGQAQRHGEPVSKAPQTEAEARAAVHLAATLVQFAVSKAIELA